MAIGLENYPNIEPISAEYPSGSIKDRDGSTNGTPVNRTVYTDVHQFFAKLLRLAGITPSGDAENEANGFQYITALDKFVNPSIVWHNVGGVGEPAFQPLFSSPTPSNPVRFSKRKNYVSILGSMQRVSGAGSSLVFTLPIGYRPNVTISTPLAYSEESGIGYPFKFTIGVDGTVNIVVIGGTFAATSIFLFSFEFPIIST